jgi:hypothetical protein
LQLPCPEVHAMPAYEIDVDVDEATDRLLRFLSVKGVTG